MGFDFNVIVPLLLSHCGFFFVFGCEVSFLVSSSVFLSMIVQQLFVIPVLSQEGVFYLILISYIHPQITSCDRCLESNLSDFL